MVVNRYFRPLKITIFLFTSLQLRSVQATDARSECGFADCFTLRLLATVLGLGVIVAVLSFATDSTAVRAIVSELLPTKSRNVVTAPFCVELTERAASIDANASLPELLELESELATTAE